MNPSGSPNCRSGHSHEARSCGNGKTQAQIEPKLKGLEAERKQGVDVEWEPESELDAINPGSTCRPRG